VAKKRQTNPAEEARREGLRLVYNHPMFAPFRDYCEVYDNESSRCPDSLYASVTSRGEVHLHPRRRLLPDQWAWVIAHCFLHLGLDHHREHAQMDCWTQACDEAAARLLAALKFGQPPEDYPPVLPGQDEESRYQELLQTGYQSQAPRDLVFVPGKVDPPFSQVLAHGIRLAVEDAVARAAGQPKKRQSTTTTRARDWFLSSYPLLGALAGAFEIVEDAQTCRALGIQIAAVHEGEGRIYLNPEVRLEESEVRFVLAHEFLHAGLGHGARCQDRQPFLWNLACDFVVNGWLIEMGVGEPPRLGVLHDPEWKGLSVEQVYELICCDARRFGKLGTLAGHGLCDILGTSLEKDWHDLDDTYRRCLSRGLELHQNAGRGLLPAGLTQAIRALDHPPIPWDVELARWFDQYFPPLERLRSYARPSRRQQATPDIPRPSRQLPALPLDARTFGVVLDTSGSMDRQILGKALGAIAAYAQTRDVPAVRLICCDAQAYDLGYLPAENIAQTIRLKGRGGTVLQPGLNLLHQAEDFPKKGPILIITDAQCDRLQVAPGRHHAYLVPASAVLPMVPRGPVFRIARS
jgi:predicted metal-dependent peptidase